MASSSSSISPRNSSVNSTTNDNGAVAIGPLQRIQQMIETAMVVQFCSTFKNYLGVHPFTPKEFEEAILNSSSSTIIDELVRGLLYFLLNRKVPFEAHTWEFSALPKALKKNMSDFSYYGYKTPFSDLGNKFDSEVKNPLGEIECFHDLDPVTKVIILANLCDWAAVSSTELRAVVRSCKGPKSPEMRLKPTGFDKDKNEFYHFDYGSADARIYQKRRTKKRKLNGPIEWAVKCSSMDDLNVFLAELKSVHTSDKQHLSLTSHIEETIIPRLGYRLKQSERAQRRLLLHGMSVSNIMLTTGSGRAVRRRTDVKYSYSSDDEEEEEKEEEDGVKEWQPMRPSVPAVLETSEPPNPLSREERFFRRRSQIQSPSILTGNPSTVPTNDNSENSARLPEISVPLVETEFSPEGVVNQRLQSSI
eukprot:5601_1